ncbi:unannotated protein [freshwater metagenome]|uniref:Unannotated protein n=1 Tax=freshwater metagenome TaxID=449393 RepID=A0A6J7C066_9ZZZZ
MHLGDQRQVLRGDHLDFRCVGARVAGHELHQQCIGLFECSEYRGYWEAKPRSYLEDDALSMKRVSEVACIAAAQASAQERRGLCVCGVDEHLVASVGCAAEERPQLHGCHAKALRSPPCEVLLSLGGGLVSHVSILPFLTQ